MTKMRIMMLLCSLRGVLDSFERFTELHEAIGDLYVGGPIEPGLSGVEAFKAQFNDLLDYHGVVSGFENGVDIFEIVRVVVHFHLESKNNKIYLWPITE